MHTLREGTLYIMHHFRAACVGAGLAGLALNAYPEAYSEFKHLMLAFVYDEDATPVHPL